VLLPPERITEAGPIQPAFGVGVEGVNKQLSEIEFTSSGSESDHGWSDTTGENHWYLDKVTLTGPGNGTTTGHAINIQANAGNCEIGDVKVVQWAGAVLHADGGTSMQIRKIRSANNDPGAHSGADGLYDIRGGVLWNIGTLYPAPVDSQSGTLHDIVRTGGTTDIRIGTLNIGGETSGVLTQFGTNVAVTIGQVNFEPVEMGTQNAIFNITSEGPVRVGSVRVNDAQGAIDMSHVYRTNGGTGHRLAEPKPQNGASYTTPLRNDATASGVIYEGVSTDVTENSGGTVSPGIACLADLTLVT
jgi:hypothetical protein